MNKQLPTIDIKGNTKNNHWKMWETRGRTGTFTKAGYATKGLFRKGDKR